MININFDRPLLLLIAIPLLALVIVPFAMAIRKENKTKSAVVSLIIHLFLAVAVTLAAAGTSVVRIMTRTQVVVLADVSYSAAKNEELADEYIRRVEDELPGNSEMGVVTFGKNYKLHTPIGEEYKGLSADGVDVSGTNIKSALEYAATLFDEGVVRRIVLITDGKQTSGSGLDGIVGVIEDLYEQGIYVDAMYLDDNLRDSDREVQISGVEYLSSTYLNHAVTADVLVQSSSDRANATVTLTSGVKTVGTQYVTLTKGYNVVNFELPTSEVGEFDYKVEVSAVDNSGASLDTSDKNNSYTFTQTVTGKLNVLLVTERESDIQKARQLYGEDAEIDIYLNDPAVPCTVESLIKYDEIILSDVDVRKLDNFKSFVSSVDTVVSEYGKSLMTFGDLKIQNQTDDILKDLEDMLPVKYGNSDQDPKLMCLVMDTSRSMEFLEKLIIAKEAAKQMVGLLNDHDFLIIITFSGDYTTVWPSSPVGGHREQIYELIDGLKPTQGTVLGKGMREAYNKITGSVIEDKQVFLISDGRTWANEEDDAVEIASELLQIGVKTSVLNTGTKEVMGDEAAIPALMLLRGIAEAGQGNYYAAMSADEIGELMLTEIADDVTESVIEKRTKLNVKLRGDKMLDGIESALPYLNGYVYAKAKASSTTVLTADFVKTGGAVVEAPIYSYWNYGNGRVSSFMSAYDGEWVSDWSSGSGEQFFSNMATTNVPRSKIDYPFVVDIERDGGKSILTVTPETLNYEASAIAEILFPDGKRVEKELVFNSRNYVYQFDTELVGKYSVRIKYSYTNREYEAALSFDIPYADEYNSFTVYDVSDLYKMIRTRGGVFADGSIKLENNKDDIATYTYYLTLPCMVAAVIAYVVDIIIRKLTLADIKSLLGIKDKTRKAKRGGDA